MPGCVTAAREGCSPERSLMVDMVITVHVWLVSAGTVTGTIEALNFYLYFMLTDLNLNAHWTALDFTPASPLSPACRSSSLKGAFCKHS